MKAPKAKRPAPPMSIAMRYMGVLRRWVEDFRERSWTYLERHWKFPEEGFHHDASQLRGVAKAMGDLDLILEESINAQDFEGDLDVLATQISKQGRLTFNRVVGISLHSETGVSAAMFQFRERNVGLIKSLGSNLLEEMRETLTKAEAGAWRVEDLRKQIQSDFDVSRSKADLLARDQVLKLNGQLSQLRQQNAGISEYTWSTSGDERVREIHGELDGTRQSWDAPPIVSEDGRREHPGGDYQCRCVADPIIPWLDPQAE